MKTDMNTTAESSFGSIIASTKSESKTNPRWVQWILVACMFASGACGLVLEYIQASVSSFILGNSIHQWAIVIAMMLFMMGVASKVQRFFVGKRNLMNTFIYIEISLALIGAYSALGTYAAYAYLPDHFELVQYFFIMSIGFLIGLEIPVIMRINDDYADKLSVNIDQIFSADYIGSLTGALVFVYVLIRYFPMTEASFVIAGVNFMIAVVAFLYFWKRGLLAREYLTLFMVILTAASLVYGYRHNREWNFKLEQHLYDDKIEKVLDTQYQHIVVTHNPTLDELRLYINGNLQFSSHDEYRYHELLVHPGMKIALAHKKVLILGGGDGMALREVLKYKDVEEVLVVDLDPKMTEYAANDPTLRKLNDGAFDDARVRTASGPGVEAGELVPLFQETGKEDEYKLAKTEKVAQVHVMNIDADKFLNAVRGKYDVVIVDLPDPSSIELAKLYSRGFYNKIRRILTDGGVMVVQSTSPDLAKESFLCVKRTIEAANLNTIPYHTLVTSFGDWGWILATKKDYPKRYLEQRMNNLQFDVDTRYITAELFNASRVFGKDMLESKNTEISTMMRPVILDTYLLESWKYD